jgi:hypothetical protein
MLDSLLVCLLHVETSILYLLISIISFAWCTDSSPAGPIDDVVGLRVHIRHLLLMRVVIYEAVTVEVSTAEMDLSCAVRVN